MIERPKAPMQGGDSMHGDSLSRPTVLRSSAKMVKTAASRAASAQTSGDAKVRSLRGAAKQASVRSRDLELRIWALLEAGKTPTAIASEVGIARQSVHRIIRRVEEWYGSQIFATVDRIKRKQARRLQIVVDEAMVAWARSVDLGTRTISAKRSSGHKRGSEIAKSTTKTAGDPQYLRVAIDGLRQIRELYGIGGTAGDGAIEFDGGGTLKITTVWGTPAETGDPAHRPTALPSSDQGIAASPVAQAVALPEALPSTRTIR